MASSSFSISFCRAALRFPLPWTNGMPSLFWYAFSLRCSRFRWRSLIPSGWDSWMLKSSSALRNMSGMASMSFLICFVTDFFQTKVYLLAQDSILVPSMKSCSPESSPIPSSNASIPANRFLMQGARWRRLNLAMAEWSGAGLPSRRYMKLMSRLQADSILRELRMPFMFA